MSLIITGRKGHAPVGKAEIRTPSDGYRALAAAVLYAAINEGCIEWLWSRAAETYFVLLDIDPGAAREALLKKAAKG